MYFYNKVSTTFKGFVILLCSLPFSFSSINSSLYFTKIIFIFVQTSDGRDQEFEFETETETLILGLMELRPRPRLLFWVSWGRDRDRDFHFGSRGIQAPCIFASTNK